MAIQATYDDANLILKLYELRREEKMREARDWFATNFKVSSMEELNKIAPMGSKENAYLRMVASYWEMAAGFVTSGILNKELFFQSSGELLFVWERIKPFAPAFREMMKNPSAWSNMESVANDFVAHMTAKSPEWYGAFQAMVASR